MTKPTKLKDMTAEAQAALFGGYCDGDTIEFWDVFYSEGPYKSKHEADYVADDARIACVHITVPYTEGEGL